MLRPKIKSIVWEPWAHHWPETEIREKYIASLVRSSSTLFTHVWRGWGNAETVLNEIEQALLYSIEGHASQTPRKTGEPYVSHPISVAINCAKNGIDKEGIIAALLHDIIEDTDTTKEELAARFGEDVAEIVDGLSKVKSTDKARVDRDKVQTFLKIIAANKPDNLLRTLLIKILDRMDNMKTIDVFRVEKQRRYAQETIYIYSSLASILGMRLITADLIAKSLKPFFPEEFKKISKKCDLRNKTYILEATDLQDSIRKIIGDNVNIKFLHFYPSIADYLDREQNKLKLSSPPLKLRIRVPAIHDMYRVLGYIHTIGMYDIVPTSESNAESEIKIISDSWRDYVVSPLANGYRALTTTVVFRKQTWIIEIVSQQTEGIVDWGILSDFKNKNLRDFYYTSIVAFINNISNISKMRYNDLQNIASKAVTDIQIRLSTGSFIRLTKGSTIIELAYLVDSDLGLYCSGAIVNGEKKPPLYVLHHGESVELTTQEIPNIKNLYFEVIKTGTALENYKNSVRSYYMGQAYESGKEICKQFISLNNMDPVELKSVIESEEPDLCTVDEIINIGLGKSTVAETLESHGIDVPYEGLFSKKALVLPRVINDIKDLMYYYPPCCNIFPLADEEVVMQFLPKDANEVFTGLIQVHNKSCPNIDLQRTIIPIQWDVVFPKRMPLKIYVEDCIGIAGKITGIVSKNHLNILALSASSGTPIDDESVFSEVLLDLELRHDDNLKIDQKRFITCVKMLRKLKEVKRIETARE
jgi:GTP diphosphokinase / guanosine-3',5'-bis(diphosphate) 3'-diphosphatase